MARRLALVLLLTTTTYVISQERSGADVSTDDCKAADVDSTYTAEMERAENAAELSSSPQDSDYAMEAAISAGRIDKGAQWIVETAVRKVVRAGHTSDEVVAAVRGYGLLVLLLHIEAFATQITRELLRGVQNGTGAVHARALAFVCGMEAKASRALVAAVDKAATTLMLPRAITTGFVAHCAVHQSAAAALVEAGASTTIMHVGRYSLIHLLAHFGDAALARDVAATMTRGTLLHLLRLEGTPAQVTPIALATSKDHPQCAAALAELANEPHDPADTDGAVGGATSIGATVDDDPAASTAQNDGGWGGGSGQVDPARCDVAVEDGATLDVDTFASRYIWAERPVLIRGGAADTLAPLQAMLSKAALVEGYGEIEVEVGAAPYYEAGEKRQTTIGEFAEEVASGSARTSGGGGSAAYLFLGLYAASGGKRAELKDQLEGGLPLLILHAVHKQHLYYPASTQFSLGPAGSGSPPHYHMAAVNVLVYGRKRWTLLPPNDAVYGALPVREWHAAGGPEALRDQGHRVLECVQRPGDMLYVPDHWGHAVLNMEPSVGFATEVATARGHSMRLELRRASE